MTGRKYFEAQYAKKKGRDLGNKYISLPCFCSESDIPGPHWAAIRNTAEAIKDHFELQLIYLDQDP